MLPMLLVGCGKEKNNLNIREDFIEIQSMEYSSNSSKTTIYSRFYIDAEIDFDVTEEEYNSATIKLEDYEYKNYISSTNIKQDKSNIPNISNDNLNIGTTYYAKEYYHEYGDGYYVYRAYTIKSFKVVYVQMKIISDSVIEIIDDDEHYIVQTVYYKANFFN